MKRTMFLLVVCTLLLSQSTHADTPEEYIESAQQLIEARNYKEALALLDKGVKEYPENSDLFVYLGLYTGMSAGQSEDYTEAGRLSMLSFSILKSSRTRLSRLSLLSFRRSILFSRPTTIVSSKWTLFSTDWISAFGGSARGVTVSAGAGEEVLGLFFLSVNYSSEVHAFCV